MNSHTKASNAENVSIWWRHHEYRRWTQMSQHLAVLTHWGRATHTHAPVSWAIIGSENGLWPYRRQDIIWTNAESLLIGPRGTNFSEILIEIPNFLFKKMSLKMSSGKWRRFCSGLNVNEVICNIGADDNTSHVFLQVYLVFFFCHSVLWHWSTRWRSINVWQDLVEPCDTCRVKNLVVVIYNKPYNITVNHTIPQ